MKGRRLPDTDSVEELARFWDNHDLTDFAHDLQEVSEPLFVRARGTSLSIELSPAEAQHLRKIARSKGVKETAVLSEWILERLHGRKSDRDTMRPQYDFSSAVRGATAARYAQGANIAVSDAEALGIAKSQNQASGAAANKWGRETARQIASRIGAVMRGSVSNEASLDGKNIVIKCAARKTNSVGVTFKMLKALDAVIGAFQVDDGSFEVWSLPSDVFRAEMSDTRSRGPAAGKVGIVRRAVFSNRGTLVERVRADWAEEAKTGPT